MVKRLLLVHNPRSTHREAIQQEVLADLRGLNGWMVGKYAVKPQGWADNIANLTKILNDGDLVVVAGGDGTAAMVANAILTSGKKVTLGVLGYGNFNDVAKMLGTSRLTGRKGQGIQAIIQGFEQGQIREIWPLEVMVDDKHWRYALCYLTAGMMAEATTVFETPKARKKLLTGKKGLVFSIRLLAGWYFRRYGQQFLPEMQLNGELVPKKTSDYFAVNGSHVAKIMRGGEWFKDDSTFGSTTAKLGGIFALLRFMLHSMVKQIPLSSSEGDILAFSDAKQGTKIALQTEGESEIFENLQQIRVAKAKEGLKVVIID